MALQIRGQYEGTLIAQAPQHWSDAAPAVMAARLLEPASRVDPFRVRTRKRGPKLRQSSPYADGSTAGSHHSTAQRSA